MTSGLRATLRRMWDAWDAVFTCSAHGDLYIERGVTLDAPPVPRNLEPIVPATPVVTLADPNDKQFVQFLCPTCTRPLLRRHCRQGGRPMPAT